MLFLVATPIGNLADFSFRAVETLKQCDYVLCEDTRHTATLLNHYQIKKPLKSYHKFNESASEDEIITDLQEGKQIVLVSDAGSPGIADPGALLVKKCRQLGLAVTSIPGACAAVAALSISGFETTRFQFFGFLPKKREELKKALHEALAYPGTSICYESPNRLKDTLLILQEISPDRSLGIARELTKYFEEFLGGTAEELLKHWGSSTIKGEIVLLIGENQNTLVDWSQLSPQEHVALMEETYGLTRIEAVKTVAQLRGVSKNTIYQLFHK